MGLNFNHFKNLTDNKTIVSIINIIDKGWHKNLINSLFFSDKDRYEKKKYEFIFELNEMLESMGFHDRDWYRKIWIQWHIFQLDQWLFSGEIKNTGRLLARFAISCFKPLMREGLFDVGQCGCFWGSNNHIPSVPAYSPVPSQSVTACPSPHQDMETVHQVVLQTKDQIK